MLKKTKIIAIIIIVLSFFYYKYIKYLNEDKLNLEKVNILIGILSKPDNFEFRNAIRETWFNFVEIVQKDFNFFIKPLFVIGNKKCNLSKNLLKDEYSCRKICLKSNNINKFKSSKFTNYSLSKHKKNIFFGFSFRVILDIDIQQLGIANCLFQNLTFFKANIVLLNALNEKIIGSVYISNLSKSLDGYLYEEFKNQSIRLPKGFIGKIYLDDYLNYNYNSCTNITKQSDCNLIEFLNFYGIDFTQLIDLNSKKIILGSLTFTMANKNNFNETLNKLQKEQENYENYLNLVYKKLNNEINSFQDIVLLDLVDYYRNLPEKLIQFAKYSIKNYKFNFFIKTDDDSFLNLPNIVKVINNNKTHNRWFGKKNWEVNELGKWQEQNYQALVYPPFACGSAYMLTYDLVKWLATNHEKLFRFQGEDVSLGIWLSAIQPKYKHDTRWSCGKEVIHKDFFSLGQVNWSNFKGVYKKILNTL